MKLLPSTAVLAVIALISGSSAFAESHRATRLGNPATRFADPLSTPDDLRARFRDPTLRPDFAAVLRQWGWQGNVNDMFTAAAASEIKEVTIPVDDVMPFMSSREGGKPICLRNVTWRERNRRQPTRSISIPTAAATVALRRKPAAISSSRTLALNQGTA